MESGAPSAKPQTQPAERESTSSQEVLIPSSHWGDRLADVVKGVARPRAGKESSTTSTGSGGPGTSLSSTTTSSSNSNTTGSSNVCPALESSSNAPLTRSESPVTRAESPIQAVTDNNKQSQSNVIICSTNTTVVQQSSTTVEEKDACVGTTDLPAINSSTVTLTPPSSPEK